MKNTRWILGLIVLITASTTSVMGENGSNTSSSTDVSTTGAPNMDGTTTEESHDLTIVTTIGENESNNTTVDELSTTSIPNHDENYSTGVIQNTDSTTNVINELTSNTAVTSMSTTGDITTTENAASSSTTTSDPVTWPWPTKSFDEYDVDENFYYDLPDDTTYTQNSIKDAMDATDVVSYIANLTNDIQRYMVTENLRRCPLSDLCHVSLSNVYLNYRFDMECCWSCSCESECVRNGDCCPDAPWVFEISTENKTLPQGVKKTCLPRGIPDRGNPRNNRIERIKALMGCPEGIDSELLSKCSQNYLLHKDSLSLYDVTFASNEVSGTIYRNVYCALCNGESIINLTLWQPELSCGAYSDSTFSSTQEIVPRVLSGTAYCDVVFRVPETLDPVIESCSMSVARCNETGLWNTYNATIEAACELYGHIIEIELDGETDGTLFRNPICAICNGFSPDRVGCVYSTNYNEKYTFSGLLRLQDKSSTHDDDTAECTPGTQYDEMKRKCREVHCAVGREFVEQRCLAITHIRKFMDYILTVRVRPLKDMLLTWAYEIAADVGNKLYEKIASMYEPHFSCGPDVLIYVSSCQPQTANGTLELNSTYFKFYDFRFYLTYASKHNSTEYTNYFLSMNNFYVAFENQSIVILDNKGIEFGNMNASFKVNILRTNKTRFEKAYEAFNEIAVHSDFETDRYAIAHESNDVCIILPLSIDICFNSEGYDIMDLRPCPMFNISLDEYNFVQSIDGLYIASHNVTLDVSEYSFHEDLNSTQISVCIDLYRERFLPFLHKVADNGDFAEIIVSVVFVGISIICLIFSLLTYVIFKQLQTLPGKNNMALITCLLIAQSMYLVGSFGGFHRGTIPCKVIGLLTHFCWLQALFWMQICTFHMYRVLSKMRAMHSSTGNRKYVLYHTYTLVMSSVFVLINVAVSLVTSDRTDMGYATGACYISTQTMIEWTFGLPAALIVIGNFTLFCIIVIKLKRAPDVNKNVQNERNYILVFAKLSTITGTTWAFGFAYMWTELAVLSYLFIIFNASQGVFVMLAFVCNKRTFNLYTDVSVKLRSSIRERSIKTESSSL